MRRMADGGGAVSTRLYPMMIPILPLRFIGDIVDGAVNGDIGVIPILSVILC